MIAMYDFTKASDLVKWAKEQYKKSNIYSGGGIGRYNGQTRLFDCCGLFKCFMWHDYSQTNASYYGKVQPDYNCEGLLAEAKEKGDISTIPEIPGVLVYMKGHMGIYIGNGKVLESTAKKYNGVQGKIYRTYFKGDGAGCDGKRTTWTKWFKSPHLSYNTPSNIQTGDLYQTYDLTKKKWLPNVHIGSNDYAGNSGNPISALYIDNKTYRVHDMEKKKYLPFVNGRQDYAGNIGHRIDGIQIENATYRVQLVDGRWLSWITKVDNTSYGYAGIYGIPIACVQIKK